MEIVTNSNLDKLIKKSQPTKIQGAICVNKVTGFMRTHQDERIRSHALFFSNTYYPVIPQIAEQLMPDVIIVDFIKAIDTTNTVFLLPIKRSDLCGFSNEWTTSLIAAAQMAENNWVRIKANNTAQQYEIYAADKGYLPEPEWPNISFEMIMSMAFKGRIIDSLDHPIVKQLRGKE